MITDMDRDKIILTFFDENHKLQKKQEFNTRQYR